MALESKTAANILVLTTGGTIDGVDLKAKASPSGSAAAGWFAAQKDLRFLVSEFCKKDSREISDGDREAIAQKIDWFPGTRVIITHGTFTIAETGRFLKDRFARTSKIILLVGAWIPFEQNGSDAVGQLEFAVTAIQSCEPGVWIAMDRQLRDPARTEKREVSPGVFRLIDSLPAREA